MNSDVREAQNGNSKVKAEKAEPEKPSDAERIKTLEAENADLKKALEQTNTNAQQTINKMEITIRTLTKLVAM